MTVLSSFRPEGYSGMVGSSPTPGATLAVENGGQEFRPVGYTGMVGGSLSFLPDPVALPGSRPSGVPWVLLLGVGALVVFVLRRR